MQNTNAKSDPIKSELNTNSTEPISFFLEVNAAYYRSGLEKPRPNGPNGRQILSMEMLLYHPFYWDWLNESETTEVLMELYVARTRRSQ